MKIRELKIISDGSVSGTHIYADNKPMAFVQQFILDADSDAVVITCKQDDSVNTILSPKEVNFEFDRSERTHPGDEEWQKLVAATVPVIRSGHVAAAVNDLIVAVGAAAADHIATEAISLIAADTAMDFHGAMTGTDSDTVPDWQNQVMAAEPKDGKRLLAQDIGSWTKAFVDSQTEPSPDQRKAMDDAFNKAMAEAPILSAFEGLGLGEHAIHTAPERKDFTDSDAQEMMDKIMGPGAVTAKVHRLDPSRFTWRGKSEHELSMSELKDAVMIMGQDLKQLGDKKMLISQASVLFNAEAAVDGNHKIS